VAHVARKLRIEYPGALYHVINRGNYRRAIFGTAGAAAAFVTALEQACAQFAWRMHAFALVYNHFHLALETPQPNLVDGMHWLQTTFASRFNRYRDERGHLFQGRYHAPLIEDFAALTRVVSYIHLNPVRAHLVTADQMAAFRWSSLRRVIKGPRPDWLVADRFLTQLGFQDNPAGWADYVRYLRALAADPEEQQRLGFDELSDGRPIGTIGWRRAIARELSPRAFELGFERQDIIDIKTQRWLDELELGLRELGRSTLDIPDSSSSASWKIGLAARLRCRVAAPYRWICEQLHMASPTAVRMHVYRSRKLGPAHAH
jgi:putative transposase